MKKRIEWKGFLKHAVDSSPEEACAFLYSDRPLEQDGKWFVFSIKNVSKSPLDSWQPDKKEVREVKKKAREMKLIKIGNIHTHILSNNPSLEEMDQSIKPSEKDLNFAKRFNDIVRGILIVNKKVIYGIRFHDMFGREIEIYLEGPCESYKDRQ